MTEGRHATSLTAEAYLAWSLERHGGARHELLDGAIVAMGAECAGHARIKAKVNAALARQITERALPCEAFPDGMAVRVDDVTVFEPDALVRCGSPLDDEAVIVTDPCCRRRGGLTLDAAHRRAGEARPLLPQREPRSLSDRAAGAAPRDPSTGGRRAARSRRRAMTPTGPPMARHPRAARPRHRDRRAVSPGDTRLLMDDRAVSAGCRRPRCG